MPRTRRQLIDATLDKLGVLVPGQSPGDEAVSRVDGYIEPCFAELAAIGLPNTADTGLPDPPSGGEFDDSMFNSHADYLANMCKGAFNLGDDPHFQIMADRAEAMLRVIGRPASTRQTLRTDAQLRGGSSRAPIGNFTRGS
jgi:hypothetical protein